MLLLYVLLGLLLFLCIIHHVINNNSKARMIRKIPGLKDYFLIGNALHVMAPPVELFRLLREFAARYNGIYKFYAYPHSSVNIYNPEDIEIITSSRKHHEKSVVYKFMRPWLRDGLLLSSGDKWQHRRKILTSAFHFNVLRQYFIVLTESAQRLVQTLDETMEERTNVVTVISEYTLDSICESAMGTSLDGETTASGKEYKNAIHDMGQIMCYRIVRMYLYPDFIFNNSSWGKKQEKILSVIHNFTEDVIKKRKLKVNNGEIHLPEEDDNGICYKNKKNKTAMLDLLIAAERDGLIDEDGIQEEVDTFMFEGHDTTAAGLALFLMVIANNPSAQEKVFIEQQEIFCDTTREPTMEDCNKMVYLERCIKESLRLYPPVPFISRRISETVKLSNYTVPEGTYCHIHIYDLHRRADLYPNPLKFDPDRFLPENSVGRHNFAYIPFSAGPRNCIGQKFAMMEMKLALSTVLRHFELKPVSTPDDMQFKSDIVLRNDLPIYVKFVKRNIIKSDTI